MARAKLSGSVYITINGKKILYFEEDADGNIKWHLTKEQFKQYEDKMMANVSRRMSEYVSNNPGCTLLNA